MKTITPLAEVKKKAIETALNYVMYRGYNGSEAKAVAALKRRCPGRSKDECLKWLQRSEMVFKECIEFLDENKAAAFEVYSGDETENALLSIADEIKREYSDFPDKELSWALNLVFLNYHLR